MVVFQEYSADGGEAFSPSGKPRKERIGAPAQTDHNSLYRRAQKTMHSSV